MALTLRTDGSSAPNLVGAAWWNDYYDLLTGSMNDQPVYLYYEPASGSNPPTLKLQSNGNADLLWFQNSGGTKVLYVSTAGVISNTNQYEWLGTLGGSKQTIFTFQPTDGGSTAYTFGYDTSYNLYFYNSTTSTTIWTLSTTGALTLHGGVSATTGNFSGALTVTGAFSSDGGAISSNGSGSLTTGNHTALQITAQGSGTGNDDLLKLVRTANTTQTMTFGVDNTGALYCYDSNAAQYVFSGLKGQLPIATNRSGTNTPVAIYSGSGTPSGDGVTTPPTGAIWVKA